MPRYVDKYEFNSFNTHEKIQIYLAFRQGNIVRYDTLRIVIPLTGGGQLKDLVNAGAIIRVKRGQYKLGRSHYANMLSFHSKS